MHIPPGYAMFIPSAIRKAVDLPVVGVGRFKDPLQAERALAEGHCDLVGVVRGQIADADFAAKARAGVTDDIRLCLSCNQECVGRMGLNRWLGCIENPRTGRESEGVGEPRPVTVAATGAGGRCRAGRPAGRHRRGPQRPPRHGAASATEPPAARCAWPPSVPNRAEFGDLVRNQLHECGRLGVRDRVRRRRPPRTRWPAGGPTSWSSPPGPTPARPWWAPAEADWIVDVRDVLDGSAAPVGVGAW